MRPAGLGYSRKRRGRVSRLGRGRQVRKRQDAHQSLVAVDDRQPADLLFAHVAGDVCRLLFPGAPEFTTPAHRDQTFLKREDEVWSAWIPLGDCPRMQGSLAVLPRSNHAVPPPGSRWRRFDFSAGDVLFVNSLTLHRALPNRSAEIRVSVDFRFCRA